MIQSQIADFNSLCLCSSVLTSVTAEYDNVQQGVTHQSVFAVYTAGSLTCNEQVFYAGLAVCADLNAAVLIVQCRIDQHRLLPDINAVLQEHSQHSRDALFDGAFAVDQIDHRRIQPYALTAGRCVDLLATTALTDNGRCGNVTSLQRIHEYFAVYVNQLCAQRTNLFGNQCAEDLFRECSTGRVILQGVLLTQRSANTISQNQTVCGCTVVVGSREALVVHSACTAGSNDNNLCLCDQDLAGFQQHLRSDPCRP